jgi:hypothetical protein
MLTVPELTAGIPKGVAMATVLVSGGLGRSVDLYRDPDGIGPGLSGRAGAARGHRPGSARPLPPGRGAVPSVHPRAGPAGAIRSRPGRTPAATMIAARHRSPSAPT